MNHLHSTCRGAGNVRVPISRIAVRLGLAIVAAILMSPLALAQFNASISGTVLDPRKPPYLVRR